jgi:DNA-binding NtrC family response regulator
MPLIAIVHEDAAAAAEWAIALAASGYRVVTTGRFADGETLLDAEPPPALLIASVRLGAYNGLHLVIRARVDHPHMPAILTSAVHDASLAAEAGKYGAAYLAGPLDPEALVSHAVQLLGGAVV